MAQNGRGGDRQRVRDANHRERSIVSRSGDAHGEGRRGGDRFAGFADPFERLGNPFRMLDEMSSGFSSRMSSMFQDDQLFNDPFFTEPFGRCFGTFNEGFSARGGGGGAMGRNSGGDGGRNVRIEEIPRSDDDDDGRGGSSNEPIVEHPDDEGVVGGPSNPRTRSFVSNFSNNNDSGNCYSFQSSAVYSAGPDGPQYAARATRRQGPEGIVEEEFQEKDSRARKATHRISHGLGDKGRSITRKKQGENPEERFQTLHNLGEDEVRNFERTWESKAQTAFPKRNSRSSLQQIGNQ